MAGIKNKNNGSRKADVIVESNYRRFVKKIKLVSTTQIKMWQALILIMFVAGFGAAVIWTYSTEKMEGLKASGEVRNTASVSYQDSLGSNYYGQSNENVIQVTN